MVVSSALREAGLKVSAFDASSCRKPKLQLGM